MEPAREEVETSFKESNVTDAASVSTQSKGKDKGSETHGVETPVNSDVPIFPIMYPTLVPTLRNLPNQEAVNHGAGIYAVTTSQLMGPFAGFPPNTLVPLTYSLPTRPAPGAAATGEEGQVGQQQQQQHQGPQRQVVVRRFQIAIQLDLLLILKLAAVIFLFNQDGSRQRLILLVFFASLIYLYQTGALTPLVRWLSQGMQRAAAPPQPPRPAARADNLPFAAVPANENAARPADGQAGDENENQPLLDGNQAAGENEQVMEPPPPPGLEENGGGNRWWGIVKEVQMIVFGFITSLLPGFHNIEQH